MGGDLRQANKPGCSAPDIKHWRDIIILRKTPLAASGPPTNFCLGPDDKCPCSGVACRAGQIHVGTPWLCCLQSSLGYRESWSSQVCC